MNFTGKLEGLKMDYVTRKQSLSLEVNEDARDAFQELKDCEKLVIQIKKYRKKRSLDANAYYWVLITKLARRLELSNPEMHNMCLERYGQLEIMENKAVFVTIPDTEEAENKVRNALDYHLQSTSQVRQGVDGLLYRTYRLLRGSHTYNSEEMARLISGLIIMCKDAQIPDSEIATPEEKRLLKESLERVHGRYGSLLFYWYTVRAQTSYFLWLQKRIIGEIWVRHSDSKLFT